MSYPRDIDEFTDEELLNELKLRDHRRRKGLCDYCTRPRTTPPCRFPERHFATPPKPEPQP
jgi:hypothetical protein